MLVACRLARLSALETYSARAMRARTAWWGAMREPAANSRSGRVGGPQWPGGRRSQRAEISSAESSQRRPAASRLQPSGPVAGRPQPRAAKGPTERELQRRYPAADRAGGGQRLIVTLILVCVSLRRCWIRRTMKIEVDISRNRSRGPGRRRARHDRRSRRGRASGRSRASRRPAGTPLARRAGDAARRACRPRPDSRQAAMNSAVTSRHVSSPSPTSDSRIWIAVPPGPDRRPGRAERLGGAPRPAPSPRRPPIATRGRRAISRPATTRPTRSPGRPTTPCRRTPNGALAQTACCATFL